MSTQIHAMHAFVRQLGELCKRMAGEVSTVPATVLDPFAGSGTTLLVADRLGRNCIGIELSPAYATMAEKRIRDDAGMFVQFSVESKSPVPSEQNENGIAMPQLL